MGEAYVDILCRDPGCGREVAGLLARAISAVMFVSLASPIHLSSTNEQVADDIRAQVRVLLRS